MLGTNGSTGTMNVNTSGNINLGEHLIIGEAGGLGAANGTLNVDSGTFNVVNETWVGNNAGGSGTVNMSGGSITSGNWIAVGRNGSTGVVNLAGTSQMTMTNALDINAQITVGTGAGGNGTINVKDTAILTSSKMILGENDATSVGLIDQTGGTVAISDTLTVQGVGIGTYKLTGGVLIATNIGAEDGTFDMTGGRLESVTRFSGDLDQKGGILAPGASLGTMEITGNFALELPATFEMEADGSGNDMLMVGGDVNLLGDLDIIASAGLTTGTILTIIDNTGVNPLTGLFGNYATNGMTFTEDGYDWRIDYGVGSDNNDVTLTVLAVVPEPSAGILALLAIGLTFARRRR